MKIFVKILLISCLALSLSQCDSTTNDADTEADRNDLLLFLYVQNTVNWYATCTQSQTTALTCANAATAKTFYINLIETVWGTNIAAPQENTDICTATDSSTFFNQMSAGSKSCYFQCQQSYWQSASEAGECTALNYSTALTNSVSETTTCFTNCLKDDTRFAY